MATIYRCDRCDYEPHGALKVLEFENQFNLNGCERVELCNSCYEQVRLTAIRKLLPKPSSVDAA